LNIFEQKGYEYSKHLCTGGEGEVHLIKRVDKLFVAKIIPRIDEEAIKIFRNISSMNIPNVPNIHEVFNHEDKTIIIRDYIEGNTLYEEIKKNGSLSFIRAKEIVLKICDTIKSFHNARPYPIIYRDLKPENIIIMPDGDVRLIDFGIARSFKVEALRDTVLAGTRGYTAPEIMAGMQSDERSDIYSIGMLFYEMLTGKNILMPPYQIRPVAEAGVFAPDWVDGVISKATDIQQVKRYKNIDEFIDSIKNPKYKPNKRYAKLITILAAAALIAGFTAVWHFGFRGQEDKYEVLLDLTFDDDADKAWVMGYNDPEGRFAFFNGQLHLLREGCNIDFPVRAGQICHFKVKGNDCVCVGIGPFRVNMNSGFECIYFNEKEGVDYTTWNLALYGQPVKSNGHFIDIILYTEPGNEAVYALTIDEYEKSIGYTSYKIPDYMRYDIYDLAIYNFNSNESLEGAMIIESIKVSEGSLKGYLDDNFTSYDKNKERMDEFLDKELDLIPEMVLKASHEWQ
jgi:serine/threonine protein kinase